MSTAGGGNRHVWFQVHQKSSKSVRIGNGKKMLKLDFSEEIDCPSSNVHNFRSFASIELVFVLIAAEFDRLSKKNNRTEIFAYPVARCCVDCCRFLACFCL